MGCSHEQLILAVVVAHTGIRSLERFAVNTRQIVWEHKHRLDSCDVGTYGPLVIARVARNN